MIPSEGEQWGRDEIYPDKSICATFRCSHSTCSTALLLHGEAIDASASSTLSQRSMEACSCDRKALRRIRTSWLQQKWYLLHQKWILLYIYMWLLYIYLFIYLFIYIFIFVHVFMFVCIYLLLLLYQKWILSTLECLENNKHGLLVLDKWESVGFNMI